MSSGLAPASTSDSRRAEQPHELGGEADCIWDSRVAIAVCLLHVALAATVVPHMGKPVHRLPQDSAHDDMQVAFCAGFQSSKLHNTWLYSAARTFLSFQSPHVLAVMKSCELQTNGFIIAPPEHSSFQSPHVLLAMSSATDDVPWLYLQSLVRQGDKQRPEMEQLLGSSFACSCQQSMSMWPVTAGNLTDSPRSQAASDEAISGRATGHCRRVHDAHARANPKLSARPSGSKAVCTGSLHSYTPRLLFVTAKARSETQCSERRPIWPGCSTHCAWTRRAGWWLVGIFILDLPVHRVQIQHV